MRDRLPLIASALWFGSLCAIGFVAVPLLFAHLPTAGAAGQMAARLFSAQSWVSIACGLLILMTARQRDGSTQPWAPQSMGWIAAGLVLALLLEHGVAPRITARENLALWHSLGTGFYALQWVCALVVLLRVGRPAQALLSAAAAPPAGSTDQPS